MCWKKIIFLTIALMNFSIYTKVLIYTFSYNRPDFIETQVQTLKKFCKDDFELVVFNDSNIVEVARSIENMCLDLGLKHIHIPQAIHSQPYLPRKGKYYSNYYAAGVRNVNVVQWALDNYGFEHDDLLVLLDSDIFLTKNFSFREYMTGFDAASYLRRCNEWPPHNCAEQHADIKPFEYFWIGLVFLNMASLPDKKSLNFNCGLVYNSFEVDAGGYTHFYINEHPEVKIRKIERFRLKELSFNQMLNKLEAVNWNEVSKEMAREMHPVGKQKNIEFYLDDTFIHYGGGTNYNGDSADYINQKDALFKRFFEKILA